MTENINDLNKETRDAWEVNAEVWDARMDDEGFVSLTCTGVRRKCRGSPCRSILPHYPLAQTVGRVPAKSHKGTRWVWRMRML